MAERIGETYQKLNDRVDGQEPTGIVVEVKIDQIDHHALGEWIGRMDSRDQAAVVDGLASYTYGALKWNGDMQVQYLIDDLRKWPNQIHIGSLLEALYSTWKEG